MFGKDFDFNRLIWPLESNTFFRQYWETRPLVLTRGEPDYYSNLFSMRDIESVIYLTKPSIPKITLFKNSHPYVPSYANSDNSLRINQIYDAYYQGYSIRLKNLENSWKMIANFGKNLEFFFNHQVGVNMYLTPQNSQGLAPHFDTHEVFILQIEGSKNWYIYDSFLPLPTLEDQQPVPKEKLGTPLYKVCLNAGDLLYIPRGYVHEALTSECSSLHLTVGIHPFRLTDLISSALKLVSQQNVSFRKSLPIGFLRNNGMEASLRSQLEELLKLFKTSARVEDAVEHLAEQFFTEMVPVPDDGHFTQIDAINDIDIETIVEKRNGVRCRIIKEGNSVSIQFPGNIVRGPSYIEPALRFINDSYKFSIKSIPEPLSDNEKLVLVRRLVREGLLSITQKE